MQQDIEQLTLATSSAAVIARRVTEHLRELEQRVKVLQLERNAARGERDGARSELQTARTERDAASRQCAAAESRMEAQEREHAARLATWQQERANSEAVMQRELDAARQGLRTAQSELDAARQERAALRQRVAALEHLQEQADREGNLEAIASRQDDLLRHVLSATVDFDLFTVRDVVAAGGNGFVLLCDVTVPAWCAADEAFAAKAAAGARERNGGAVGASRRKAKVAVPVAVKVLAGVEDPRHTTLKHAFLREFQTLSAMPPHPNVITLLAHFTKRLPKPMYDLLPDGFRMLVGGVTNPVLALIMPLLPRTLEAAARADPGPEQLVRWCLDVSAAVAHMWEYGWVHLDLKLNNVLVAGDGRAVLTDMGTAMPVSADGSLTVPAHMGLSGNPSHRAPEVLASWAVALHDPTSLVRMDVGRQEVWALGVLLHELVAGKHPYGEHYPLEGQDVASVVDEATLVARGLPADMVAVVRRMVSSDPGARPADPAAAHAELVAAHMAPQKWALAVVADRPAHAPPVPDSLAEEAHLDLEHLEQAYTACQLNVLRHPATGEPSPNPWGRQLQTWSERHAPARLSLAVLLRSGDGGMQQNEQLAGMMAESCIAWCRGAAEGGVTVAQWLLGECYFYGAGVPQDHAQAVAWFQRAAEQGCAEAQNSLGWCHYVGNGVAKSAKQAVAWYRKAAAQGHVFAQNNLGVCYDSGEGVDQDCAKAAAWFRRAAEQGHASAQHALGACYYNGEGVTRDAEKAVAWWRRAARQGDADAQAALQRLGV